MPYAPYASLHGVPFAFQAGSIRTIVPISVVRINLLLLLLPLLLSLLILALCIAFAGSANYRTSRGAFLGTIRTINDAANSRGGTRKRPAIS